MRSFMPLDEGKGLWLSGYFPYRLLPKGLKTLVVCAQRVERPDCNVDAWRTLFSSHIVPWQFFISLVLLRCHPERHQEAVENNLDIVFFNPSFKANQQRRILFWESCVEMWVSTSCNVFPLHFENISIRDVFCLPIQGWRISKTRWSQVAMSSSGFIATLECTVPLKSVLSFEAVQHSALMTRQILGWFSFKFPIWHCLFHWLFHWFFHWYLHGLLHELLHSKLALMLEHN